MTFHQRVVIAVAGKYVFNSFKYTIFFCQNNKITLTEGSITSYLVTFKHFVFCFYFEIPKCLVNTKP